VDRHGLEGVQRGLEQPLGEPLARVDVGLVLGHDAFLPVRFGGGSSVHPSHSSMHR
jgi:hypothetical protein